MGPSHRSCDTGARPHCRESPTAVCQVPGALLEWQAGTCVKPKQNTQHVTNLRAYCCIQKACQSTAQPLSWVTQAAPCVWTRHCGSHTGHGHGVDACWQAYSYIRRQAHRQEHGFAVAEYTLAGMYVHQAHTLRPQGYSATWRRSWLAVNHATQVGGAPAHSVHVLPVFTGYCILFQERTATHTACKQTLKAAHSGWLDTCSVAVVPSCITITWTHVYDTKAPGLHTPGLGACTANSTPGC
jgi:hypothetical protein